jgi:activator of 2-hydroxyglutaryl-CoA dehydratase
VFAKSDMIGRCSVFAKSDMIHLQQIATPDYDIVAGLCYALARNFISVLGAGKTFQTPVSFQGGVAANAGIREAFKNLLEDNDLKMDPLEVKGLINYAAYGEFADHFQDQLLCQAKVHDS